MDIANLAGRLPFHVPGNVDSAAAANLPNSNALQPTLAVTHCFGCHKAKQLVPVCTEEGIRLANDVVSPTSAGWGGVEEGCKVPLVLQHGGSKGAETGASAAHPCAPGLWLISCNAYTVYISIGMWLHLYAC